MNQELSLKLDAILACDPEKRAQAIIETDDPATILQDLNTQEAYLVIKDAWEGDGQLLLPYVPPAKLPAFIDLDCWTAEGLNLDDLLEWFWALADISLEHLALVVAELDLEVTVMFFEHYIEIAIASTVDDTAPDLLADGFESLDDVFYLRFKNDVPENELVKRLLREIYGANLNLYRTIMYSADGEIKTSLEEEAYQQRRLRLAELGFVPTEEALAVYRRQKTQTLLSQGLDERLLPHLVDEYHLPSLYRPTATSLLAASLPELAPQERERLSFELVYLVNKLIMADYRPLNSSAELARAVAKAAGLISIGLAEAARLKQIPESAVLAQSNAEQLFSLGHNLILNEQQRLKELGLELNLIPASVRETAQDLLCKRPRFAGRDFEGPADLEALRAMLARLEAFKRLLADSCWNELDFAATNLGGREGLELENLSLTKLALNALKAGEGFRPLTPAEFRRFAELVLADGRLKAGFVAELAELIAASGVAGPVAADLAARLSARLESEIGGLDLAKAEPRYITAVLIATGA